MMKHAIAMFSESKVPQRQLHEETSTSSRLTHVSKGVVYTTYVTSKGGKNREGKIRLVKVDLMHQSQAIDHIFSIIIS